MNRKPAFSCASKLESDGLHHRSAPVPGIGPTQTRKQALPDWQGPVFYIIPANTNTRPPIVSSSYPPPLSCWLAARSCSGELAGAVPLPCLHVRQARNIKNSLGRRTPLVSFFSSSSSLIPPLTITIVVVILNRVRSAG